MQFDLIGIVRWFWIAVLAAVLGVLNFGCTSRALADLGMASAPPVSVAVELNDAGDLKRFEGSGGGGDAALFNLQRRTWHEGGQPKSETVVSRDPTPVQRAFYTGVADQSVLDVQNYQMGLQATGNFISQLAPQFMDIAFQLRKLNEETENERADRLAREAVRDERIDRLINAIERNLP
jgi:hypothetical protein